MSIYFFSFDGVHPWSDSAKHPIEPLATRLWVLLLLPGRGGASSSCLPNRAANGPLGRVQLRNPGAMRVKLTNMLSVFADSLGQQASRFEPVVGHGCSPKANLIFPACLGKCLVPDKSGLCKSCEEFRHSKSFVARARLLQIQVGVDCSCRSRALATMAHRFRRVRHRLHRVMNIYQPSCKGRTVVVARRMGVRAQFGDALPAHLSAFGRIGIRPQFCYRVTAISAAEKAGAGYQFCYRAPVNGAAEKAGSGYQFCYRVPAIGAVDKAGAGYSSLYFQHHQRHAGLFV